MAVEMLVCGDLLAYNGFCQTSFADDTTAAPRLSQVPQAAGFICPSRIILKARLIQGWAAPSQTAGGWLGGCSGVLMSLI